MAGISVSLDGANIQLSFQKDDQATAVVMDARAARALVRAVGQLLTAIDDTDEPDVGPTGPRTPYPVNDPGIGEPGGPGSEPDIFPGTPTDPGTRM